MAAIEFRDVEKTYPDGTRAVRDLNLSIRDGELMVLVGPSGCGKSTALRMLAGLEEISGGEIAIGDRVVNDLTPQERNIAMVFQNYALYPHMTVGENLSFPLRMMKQPKHEIQSRVLETARMLSLEALLDKKPKQLSGGQRQRVAMGRALVREPEAFLMDEPLSNLDAKLRVQMRAEIASLQTRMGTTTLYVTHDQVEALTLGDRIAILKAGELQQVGEPQEIYDHPANVFVAAFIGSPSINLFKGRIVSSGDGPGLQFGEQVLPLPADQAARLGDPRDRELVFGLRPEAFRPAESVAPEHRIRGTVKTLEALGHEIVVYVDVPVAPAAVDEGRDQAVAAEENGNRGDALDSSLLAARLPGTFHVETGETVELGVDLDQLYAFGLDGRAL